ncbi:oligopeptide ABC transporter permease [Spiroplasma sabaudiense Ar-1343]|uniref:Oligopeptide ABC transporter permease n=1 Tax=Spiroplasma sabaudiense Ar-1343 TaxID=1276257 RepID=W6AB19_9MOLU|nr:oligopeptide ABC transporter permease OppB [Spiroplasma sabaudiense]AHI54186.1 oligopeptide ABC transporter permease [Spiroplasma sabaudiense Ar-1343]
MEEKKKIEFDLQSEDFSLDDQVQDTRSSRWTKFKFTIAAANHNTNEFWAKFPLIGYSLRRIFFAIITLLLAVSAVFILLRLQTPDEVYLGNIDYNKLGISYGDPEYYRLLAMRKAMFKVDGPILRQLFHYIINIIPFIPKTIIINGYADVTSTGEIVLLGDKVIKWFYLGEVFSTGVSEPGKTVTSVFAEAIPYSFAFGVVAMTISYGLGVPLGIMSAKNKERAIDKSVNTTSIVFTAIPPVVFVVGIYLISINVFGAHGLFSSGTFDTKFWPTFAIVLMIMPPIIISTRRYVIDEMTADYTKFALSKGMTKTYVFNIHIFRNAGIRIFRTMPAAFVGTIFGSSIFTEQNWSIPGMSKFIVSGVASKDSFVVMGYIVFSAAVGIVTTLIADILMATLDPRVKLTK